MFKNANCSTPLTDAFSYPNPAEEAAEPLAPGPSLLNNTEEEFMNNFFSSQLQQQQDLSNSRFEPQQFHRPDQLHGADLASFNWLMDEPAPTFVGVAATPKQDPSPPPHHNYHDLSLSQNTNFDFTGYSDSNNNNNNNLLASSQNDILNAASILNNTASSQALQPQPSQQQMLGRLGSAPGIMESVEPIHTTEALPAPGPTYLTSQHNQIATQEQAGYAMRPVTNLNPLNTLTDVNFDGPHTAPARVDAPVDTRLYRFGSDSHFNSSGFVPGSENEREEVVAGRLIEELLLMKPINRVPTGSRPPTPEPRPGQQNRPQRQIEQGQGSSDDDDVDESQPRKRRKDGSDDGSYGVKSKMRRTSQNPRLRRVSSVETGSKRRRSSLTGSATKQARENLSEEQKRSNHIQSEQKRRNLIKQGFDELNILVPELRAGGLSKSMVLTEAGNFLEQLMNVNQQLKHRLGLLNTG
jgi:hypothetical protein